MLIVGVRVTDFLTLLSIIDYLKYKVQFNYFVSTPFCCGFIACRVNLFIIFCPVKYLYEIQLLSFFYSFLFEISVSAF